MPRAPKAKKGASARRRDPKRPRSASSAASSRADLAETAEGPSLARARSAILVAGAKVISERGFARASVEDIARAARVPTDVFYALFPGKGALLRALNQRFVDQMIAVTDASTRAGIWKDARSVEVMEVCVRSILDVVHEHAGLVRAFLSRGATDPSLVEGLSRVGAHMTRRMGDVLAECKDPPPRGERAIAFSMLLGVALAHHCVLVGEAWCGLRFTREDLAAETARAVAAYLERA